MNHFRILCSEMDAIHHWSSIHEQCFDYMNRYWVQKERSDGRKDVYDVNTLSFIKWKDEMFKPNSKLLIEQILTCIQQQRDNMIVDTNLISSAIKSLVFLSIDIQDLKNQI